MHSDLPLEYKCYGVHHLNVTQTLLHHVIGTDKRKKAVKNGDIHKEMAIFRDMKLLSIKYSS